MRAQTSLFAGALVACAVSGCNKKTEPAAAVSPAGESAAAESAAAAPPAAAATKTAAELWRLELTGPESGAVVPRAAIALAGGDVLVAWELGGDVRLPGREEPFAPTGDDDILITRIAADGSIASAHQIGGPGAEEVEGLSLAGDTPVLALRSDGALAIAGTALALPEPADRFSYPRLGALVVLDGEGAATSARPLPSDADLAIAGLRGGDVVVAASYMAEDASLFGRAVVQRLDTKGAERWSAELSGVAVNALSVLGDEVGAATRGRAGLGLELFAAASGEHRSVAALPRTPGGDLGTIAGALRHGDAILAYGETGREAVMRGGDVYSHSIEPFVVAIPAADTDAAKSPIADVTGSIAAVGHLGGKPVAVLDVIHDMALYDGRALPYRGIYLAIGTGEPVFVPVVQIDFESDDPPFGKKTVVLGERLDLRSAAFAGDAVVLLGTCDDDGLVGCVAKVALATP